VRKLQEKWQYCTRFEGRFIVTGVHYRYSVLPGLTKADSQTVMYMVHWSGLTLRILPTHVAHFYVAQVATFWTSAYITSISSCYRLCIFSYVRNYQLHVFLNHKSLRNPKIVTTVLYMYMYLKMIGKLYIYFSETTEDYFVKYINCWFINKTLFWHSMYNSQITLILTKPILSCLPCFLCSIHRDKYSLYDLNNFKDVLIIDFKHALYNLFHYKLKQWQSLKLPYLAYFDYISLISKVFWVVSLASCAQFIMINIHCMIWTILRMY